MRSTCLSRAMSPQITPGARVTCAYRDGHVGIALAIDDVRAWRGSIAFGTPTPTRADVAAHVAWCLARGLLRSTAPVLWPWGVMWDADLALA